MNKKLVFILVIALMYFSEIRLFSQQSGLSVSSGLSNIWILGDNPAGKPLVSGDSASFIYGAGFTHANSGFSLKMNYAIDKNENWNIPVGFDYFFFIGKDQGSVISLSVTSKNYQDMFSGYVGLNYNFWKIPGVNVKAFIGADLKANYAMKSDYTVIVKYNYIDSTDTRHINTKESAFRLGGLGYIGFDGVIINPLYITSSFGVGALNFFLREDNRKQFLTPIKSFESKEDLVWVTQFYLTLKYKF